MRRQLTDGERDLVALALEERAARLHEEMKQILGKDHKATFLAGEADENKLAGFVLAECKNMVRQRDAAANLALFIRRYPVNVDCAVLMAEQA